MSDEIIEEKKDIKHYLKMAWACWLLPIGITQGGLIGGGIAGGVSALNWTILKKDWNVFVRYSLSFILSLLAIIAYFLAVLAISPEAREGFIQGYNGEL